MELHGLQPEVGQIQRSLIPSINGEYGEKLIPGQARELKKLVDTWWGQSVGTLQRLQKTPDQVPPGNGTGQERRKLMARLGLHQQLKNNLPTENAEQEGKEYF